ncbi:hypothetical protein BDR04DRAFT_1098847 [Suillus decipiens]|nr:hypothetical protein BDR04DRAFT_1098847 [Suillus decipiens]
MKPNTGFVSLAQEIQFYILRLLPYRDILRCTSVCKALRQTYVSSSELQYIVELGGQCLIPVSNTDLDNHTSVSERLQHLRDKAHAWFRVDILSSKTISLPKLPYDVLRFIADGHLCSWDEEEDTASINSILPKPSQQTIERNWLPGTLCTVPNSEKLCVLMDPAQNLIAVVYTIDDETLFISLRALDDNSPHPQAAGPTLFVSKLSGHENNTYSGNVKLKVMGKHIALQCVFSNYRTRQLQIWDWQHSTSPYSVFSDEHPHGIDFCFLGNDRMLVVVDNLKLYSIEDTSQTPKLLASFVLPVLMGSVSCLLPVDGIPYSSQSQMQVQQTTYTSDPKHQLLCITTASRITSSIIYIISTRIFFDLTEMAVATPIPWKCWGPSNTRVFQHPCLGCEVHLSGNRVLLLCPVHDPYSKCKSRRKLLFNGKCKLHIMDFSPLGVANRQGLGRVVRKPSTLNVADPQCARDGYEECLTTFLPYVEVVLDREFRPGYLEKWWIDKDRIYLLSCLDKLDVIDVQNNS